MKIRTKNPDSNNNYYKIKSAGGWSPCILGNNPIWNGCVINNCVGYGVSRFNELGEYNKIKYIGNRYPRTMIATAKEQGLKIHERPVNGGLMVWAGKKEHCAIAEKVYSNGKVRTSESGWNAKKGVYNKTRSGANYGQSNKYKYLGCIENPAINPYIIPDKTIKYGNTGEFVKWLQWVLNKFYDIKIDGSYGPKTKEALKEYQKQNNLKVDGICGPETQAFIKNKYCIT